MTISSTTNCVFKVLRPEDRHFIKECTLCNTVIKSASDAADLPVCVCGYQPPILKNAITTVKQFVKSGFRIRTSKEIKHLYDTYCNNPKDPCPYFQNNTCTLCGCPVSSKAVYRNLLKIATKPCPAKPPRFKASII